MTRWLHRRLMRLVPPDVRAGYGPDIADTFTALYDDAARRGRAAIVALLAREAASAAAANLSYRSEQLMHLLKTLANASHLRQAMRSLRRRPAFAVAAIATLAVGTAFVTAIFAVVDTVLLKPLPYPNADRLVTVMEGLPSTSHKASLVAPARIVDWNARSTSFELIVGSYGENVTDTSAPDPERLQAQRVTPGYFGVLAAPTLLGRVLAANEETFGGPLAAVISEGLWARRYGRSIAALDARLVIGGVAVPVVGVMPASFGPGVDLWLPAQTPPTLLRVREARFMSGVGRLKPGIPIEAAAAELAGVQAQLGVEFPASDRGWTVVVNTLHRARVGDVGRTLWLVFGAIGTLWLIGVSNMAGLMLVQLNRRRREWAVRAAIGASRTQMATAVVHEIAILFAAGTVLGALSAGALLRLVPRVFTTLPRAAELGMDWRAFAFAAASGAAAALMFGVWPAFASVRGRLNDALAEGSRGTSGRRHRAQQVLVAAQVALSLVLSGSAALLLRSYYNLTSAPVGFSAADVVTFHVGARWDEDRQKIGALEAALLAELTRLPGVRAAGTTNFLPMSGANLRAQARVDGITGPEPDGSLMTGTRMIGHHYFEALSIPIVAGHSCGDMRTDFNAPVPLLVNQRFVEQFGGGRDLIGRDVRFALDPKTAHAIIGVAGDVAEDAPDAAPAPYVYTCDSAGAWPDPNYVVKTADPAAVAAGVRDTVRRLDPGRAVFGVRPLESFAAVQRQQPRLNAGVVTGLAGAALVTASLGLYSLFMLLVGERVREIGVRLALGATPRHVIGLVLAGTGRLVGGGMAAGLALTLAVQQVLQRVLFGVSSLDPLMLGAAVTVLAGVAAAAVAIPAMRAGRVSPVIAMKSD